MVKIKLFNDQITQFDETLYIYIERYLSPKVFKAVNRVGDNLRGIYHSAQLDYKSTIKDYINGKNY